jgi:hypothetical protein
MMADMPVKCMAPMPSIVTVPAMRHLRGLGLLLNICKLKPKPMMTNTTLTAVRPGPKLIGMVPS